jgi:hypothetical protein
MKKNYEKLNYIFPTSYTSILFLIEILKIIYNMSYLTIKFYFNV